MRLSVKYPFRVFLELVLKPNLSFVTTLAQRVKYYLLEKIIHFGSVVMFWLDISLKDIINLFTAALAKLGLTTEKRNKRIDVHPKKQTRIEKIPKSKQFVLYNVGPKQDQILFL